MRRVAATALSIAALMFAPDAVGAATPARPRPSRPRVARG
ncbi:MAG: hypothetical protein JWL71_553, partial [Acidobacteria bacterium]|nr:hypothetical protein [Acidobacteriota bacterium]